MRLKTVAQVLAIVAMGGVAITGAQLSSTGVVATVKGGNLSLSNRHVMASWSTGGTLTFVESSDPMGTRRMPTFVHAFELVIGGDVIVPAQMTVTSTTVEDLRPDPGSPRAADHEAGKAIVVTLTSPAVPGPVVWRAILRGEASYWRQQLVIGPVRSTMALSSVVLVHARAAGARVEGTAQGSPLVSGDTFVGFEHPMSVCAVNADEISCRLNRTVPLAAGQTLDVSSVAGIAELGPAAPQLPRLPRARARASVPAVPALQQLVRPRLLHAVHREGRARRHRRVRRASSSGNAASR